MDNFEKHIQAHAHLFDDHKADKKKLWNEIEQVLDTPEKKTIQLWKSPILRVAASISIIIGICAIINFFMVSKLSNTPQNNSISQELTEIDTYYKGLVSFQVQLVKNNTKLHTDDKKEFLSFMDELDQEYLVLIEEMKENLNNEYILEAIIKNYKKRIELIENLLTQINHPKKTPDNEEYIL